jgi:hypothetical protein
MDECRNCAQIGTANASDSGVQARVYSSILPHRRSPMSDAVVFGTELPLAICAETQLM